MPCFCYYIFGLRSEENLDIGTYPQISKLGHKEILQKPYWNNFKIIFLAVLAPYVYCFSAEFRDASQHGIFFFFCCLCVRTETDLPILIQTPEKQLLSASRVK